MAESRMHAETKEEVAHMLRHGPGHIIASHEVDCRWESWRIDIRGLSVVVECGYPSATQIDDPHLYCALHGRYPEMIFDIGLVRDGKVVAAIEILKSHWLDADKRRKIHKAGVMVIGVSARSREWRVDDVRLDAREFILPPRCPIASLIPIGGAA